MVLFAIKIAFIIQILSCTAVSSELIQPYVWAVYLLRISLGADRSATALPGVPPLASLPYPNRRTLADFP